MKNKKLAKILTGIVFLIVLLISFKIEVFQIVGEKKAFTLHNLIAPASFSFLNPYIAIFAVIIEKFLEGSSFVGFLFAIPTLAAMFSFRYVEKKPVYGMLIPGLAILLFLVHPEVGFKSWYFMLWVIPLVASKFSKNLFAKSITSTFNAHAAGSIIFLYFVNSLNPLIWNMLIPFVIIERIVFSAGISTSYIVFKALNKAFYKTLNHLNFENLFIVK